MKKKPGPATSGAKKKSSAGSLLRSLPQVEKVLREPAIAALVGPHPRAEVVRAVREHLAAVRASLRIDAREAIALDPGAIERAVRARLDERERPHHRRVVNGTGIILHTGLGRAVLSAEARAAIAGATEGFALVEVDVETGERNRREVRVAALLGELTGSEAATVVNNNAGATLIILAALARGKEVILSRGQMVEIGGAFRIPDVMEEGGARLVGVGTTNRTYLDDYRKAVTPQTGLLLQVHTSNYEIAGFARHTPLEELVALGRETALPVVSDLGSGCLVDLSPYGFRREPLVEESVRAGADLVCFSGDKLLGGPQAGIIVGKREAVEKVRRHPLFRALRVDKVTLAGLEATLRLYRDPAHALRTIPTLRMITAAANEVRARASALAQRLRSSGTGSGGETGPAPITAVVPTRAQTGSGSLPAQDIPSFAVSLELPGRSAASLARALRLADPPVFARVQDGKVLLDARTILPGEEPLVAKAVAGLSNR